MLCERPHKHEGELLDPAEGSGTSPGAFLLLLPLRVRGNFFNGLSCFWIVRYEFLFGHACSQCTWPWDTDKL